MLVANSSFHRSHRRRQDVPRSTRRRLRRQPRHLDRSEERRSLGRDRRRRHGHHDRSRPARSAASRCRSGRCITSPSTTSVPYWIYSNRQDDGTMRGPSNAPVAGPERAVGHVAGARVAAAAARRTRRARRRWRPRRRTRRRGSRAVGARHRRLRVGLHAARSDRPRHRLGEVLRQRGDALGRARPSARARSSPWMHTLDSPPNKIEVPLPLDAAAGDRSVRSQHGLLRLPGDLQDHERRPELERDQPRSLDAGSDAHRLVGRHRRRQPRPVLRRGGLRDRAVGDPAAG